MNPSAAADVVSSEMSQDEMRQQVTELHNRLHLTDVRVQRLRAEAFADPPLDVEKIVIHAGPCEALLEPPRFAARVTQTVTLKGSDELSLAEVEVVVVVEYTMDDGPQPSQEAIDLYIEHNAYFTAHPYLRETLQNATLKLGIEPVVLGVLSRDQPRPTEVTLVRRARGE